MEKNDLTFHREDGVFNFRVGAIIIHDNKILMVKNDKDPYFYSVGGRCKMGETIDEAIVRECKEETGVDFEIDRPGFIHENFFQVRNEKYHEVSFFYYMKAVENYDFVCGSKNEFDDNEQLVWVDLDNCENVKLFPEFFKTDLSDDWQVKHIVTRQI